MRFYEKNLRQIIYEQNNHPKKTKIGVRPTICGEIDFLGRWIDPWNSSSNERQNGQLEVKMQRELPKIKEDWSSHPRKLAIESRWLKWREERLKIHFCFLGCGSCPLCIQDEIWKSFSSRASRQKARFAQGDPPRRSSPITRYLPWLVSFSRSLPMDHKISSFSKWGHCTFKLPF